MENEPVFTVDNWSFILIFKNVSFKKSSNLSEFFIFVY